MQRESEERYRPVGPGPEGERSRGAKTVSKAREILFRGHGRLEIVRVRQKHGTIIRVDLEVDR